MDACKLLTFDPSYFINNRKGENEQINRLINKLKVHYKIKSKKAIYITCITAALFTKICKIKILRSFTKILTIILSANIVLTLLVLLPCHKCKILNVNEIFLLIFMVSVIFVVA